MKLRTLKSSLGYAPSTLRKAPTRSEQRITGRARKDRRLVKWTENPCCARCGRLTDYPHGFELDHIQRLDEDGPDVIENTQVLCVHWAPDGSKLGCHAEKTAEELRRRGKP